MTRYLNLTTEMRKTIKQQWLETKLENLDFKGMPLTYAYKKAQELGLDPSGISFRSLVKEKGNLTVGVIYRSGAKDEAKYNGYEEDRANRLNGFFGVLGKLDKLLGQYPTDSVWMRFGLENLEKGEENLHSGITIRGEIPKDADEWE